MLKEIKKTIRDEWPNFSPEQRRGAVIANSMTLVRGASVIPTLAKPKHEKWRYRDTLFYTVMAMTDMADGNIARRSGGVTSIGTVIDSVVDKIETLGIELALCSRGELSPFHVGLRAARDISLTALRSRVSSQSNGAANISANGFGKMSTTVRMGANILSTSPIGERHPNIMKSAQAVATAAILSSGAINAYRLTRR